MLVHLGLQELQKFMIPQENQKESPPKKQTNPNSTNEGTIQPMLLPATLSHHPPRQQLPYLPPSTLLPHPHQTQPYLPRRSSIHHPYHPYLHETSPVNSLHLPPTLHPRHQLNHQQESSEQQSQAKPKQKRQSRKVLPPGVAKNGRKMLISREEMLSKLDELMKQKNQNSGDEQSAAEYASFPSPIHSQSSISVASESSSGSTSILPQIREETSASSISSDESSNSSSSISNSSQRPPSLNKMKLQFILNGYQDDNKEKPL